MHTTWGFLLCWLMNIYSSTYPYRLYHGATCLRNINEVYSASTFIFILVTGLNVTQNISTAESPGRCMQLFMKPLNIIVFFLVTLSSCGQTVSTDKRQNPTKSTSKEALSIYQNMTSEICNCTTGTMKN